MKVANSESAEVFVAEIYMNVSSKKHCRNSICTVLKNVIDVILEMLLLLVPIKLPTTIFNVHTS